MMDKVSNFRPPTQRTGVYIPPVAFQINCFWRETLRLDRARQLGW
jgi:hypothetical protein